MDNVRKLRPSRPDVDNPEWTQQDMDSARPASEVLPDLIGAKAAATLFGRSMERAPKETRRASRTVRLDPDVLTAYQKSGSGWEALINAVLRQHMPGSPK